MVMYAPLFATIKLHATVDDSWAQRALNQVATQSFVFVIVFNKSAYNSASAPSNCVVSQVTTNLC
jgi:hypothetical protein